MDPRPSTPVLRLNDVLMQQSTLEVHSPEDGDAGNRPPSGSESTTAGDEDTGLASELRISHIRHVEGDKFFLPAKDISRVLSRENIANELKRQQHSQVLVDVIRPREEETDPSQPQRRETYLKVLALLLLLEREDEIIHFIQDGVCDEILPVLSKGIKSVLSLRSAPNEPLKCFQQWKISDREFFVDLQYRVSTPFFEPKPGSGPEKMIAPHYTFHDRTILPWCSRETMAASSPRSKPSSERSGGYGMVQRVKMDPRCHGFQDILEKISVSQEYFALKKLYKAEWNNQERFQNEVDQLKRFNGLVHDHIVTLLATFTLKKEYYFLFPYAECDLDLYWETRFPEPSPMDSDRVDWFSNQIRGIMGAISMIHNPTHIPERFGRHGDLKPDNILWYRSTKHDNGTFVVCDMGLSSLNHEGSRSNIPNKLVPATPGYRPPECEVIGGTISRAYDVWTLGCLFMEMAVWFLGGYKWLGEFSDQRCTEYLTGAKLNIFYDIRINPKITGPKGEAQYAIQVKPEVTEWFDKVRSHEQCTQFIRDVIYIIEKKMLVVLAVDNIRASSSALKAEFDTIHERCNKVFGYSTKPVPISMPGVRRTATAVEADLNETAQDMISRMQPNLSTLRQDGKPLRRSMRPEQMSRMD